MRVCEFIGVIVRKQSSGPTWCILVRATLTVAPADVYYMLCLLAYTTRWCRPIDIAYSKHRPVPLLELLELGAYTLTYENEPL